MTPAFYKGKLQGLINIAKAEVDNQIIRFGKLTENGPVQVNIISEINEMMTRLLLSCVAGEEFANMKVDYWIKGQLTKQNLSFALRNTFG